MADKYKLGETIVCWRNVKEPDTAAYYDPATSMKISIYDRQNGAEVENQDMIKDATGKYHYNFNSASSTVKGTYRVVYVATDGADIAIWEDNFIME